MPEENRLTDEELYWIELNTETRQRLYRAWWVCEQIRTFVKEFCKQRGIPEPKWAIEDSSADPAIMVDGKTA